MTSEFILSWKIGYFASEVNAITSRKGSAMLVAVFSRTVLQVAWRETTEISVKSVPFPTRLKLSESANLRNLSYQTKVAYESWQLLSANEESLAVIQIGYTTGELFLLLLLLYWLVLSLLIKYYP